MNVYGINGHKASSAGNTVGTTRLVNTDRAEGRLSSEVAAETVQQQTVWINCRSRNVAYEPYLLSPNRTPLIIKSRIQVQFGIPGSTQILRLDGAELDDYRSLESQKVPNHAVLTLDVKKQKGNGD